MTQNIHKEIISKTFENASKLNCFLNFLRLQHQPTSSQQGSAELVLSSFYSMENMLEDIFLLNLIELKDLYNRMKIML